MRTLIISAYDTSRLEGLPRILVRHPNGERLLKRCIMGFHNYSFDKIIIVVRNSDEEKFKIQSIIDNEFIEYSNIILEQLPLSTSCPAETIYYAIKNNNVKGEIVIHDADIYIDVPEITGSNFVVGTNIMNLNPTITGIKDKCFLKVNEQNCVLDLIEKKVKSDIICLGVYGIEDASSYESAYESLASIHDIKNQLYVSHIMSYLLGVKKTIFNYYPSTRYESWANDKAWKILKYLNGTYMINFDEFIEDPSAGKFEIYHKHVERLQVLEGYGANLLFFTSYDSSDEHKIRKCLEAYGIHPFAILFNCSYKANFFLNTKTDLKNTLIEIG